MDAWDYLDRGADLASIYGVRQRQQIVAEQRQTQKLLLQQMEMEQARADAEAQHKAEENFKREKLKRARKAVCAIEGLFQTLDSHDKVATGEIVNFVVATEQLELWNAQDFFEDLEDIRALTALQNKADQTKRKWVAAELVNSDQLKLLTEALPALNEILSQTDLVFTRCLFVHPKHEAKLRSSVAMITAKAKRLTNLIESSERDYERAKHEMESRGCRFVGGELQLPDIGLASAMTGSLERLEGFSKQMCAAAETHDSAVGELNLLRTEADNLVEEMRFGALISQADTRRQSLIQDFNEKNCDFGKIEEAKTRVANAIVSLDAELEKLAAKVPTICFDEQNKSVHSAIFWLTQIRQQQNRGSNLPALENTHFYSMIYKHGALYNEIKRELQDLVTFFETLCGERAKQAGLMRDLKTHLAEGDVFRAQKLIESQSFKICFSDFQFGGLVRDALKPYEEAQSVVASLKECETKRSGFFGKLLTSGKNYDQLRQRAEAIQTSAQSLNGEIRDAILRLF